MDQYYSICYKAYDNAMTWVLLSKGLISITKVEWNVGYYVEKLDVAAEWVGIMHGMTQEKFCLMDELLFPSI